MWRARAAKGKTCKRKQQNIQMPNLAFRIEPFLQQIQIRNSLGASKCGVRYGRSLPIRKSTQLKSKKCAQLKEIHGEKKGHAKTVIFIQSHGIMHMINYDRAKKDVPQINDKLRLLKSLPRAKNAVSVTLLRILPMLNMPIHVGTVFGLIHLKVLSHSDTFYLTQAKPSQIIAA